MATARETNIDSRGVRRGACKLCDCDQYEMKANEVMCNYCSHAPAVHQNMDKLSVVPVSGETFSDIILRIGKSFEFLVTGQQRFRLLFPTWESHRIKSIKQLRDIAKHLRTTKTNCNISTTVGSTVGLAGGVGAGIATIMAIIGSGGTILIPMGIAGAAVALAGGVATAGTNIAEALILKKSVNEAQELWGKDKAEYTVLEDYVTCAKNCKEDIEKITDLEQFKDMMFYIGQELSRGYDLSHVKQKFRNFKSFANPRLKLIAEFLEIIERFPNIEKDFEQMARLSVGALNSIQKITKTTLYGIRLGDFISDLAVQATAVATRAAGAVANASVRASIKALSDVALGIGVALDMYTLTTTIVELAKGSPCEFAVILEDCADKMEQQKDDLKKVYDGLIILQLQQRLESLTF